MAPFDVVFSHFHVVEPNLVIEIGSPTMRKRDKTIKRRLYDRAGVTEYWFVDPELNAVEVHRRVGPRFELGAELRLENSDVLQTPLLEGLELPPRRALGG